MKKLRVHNIPQPMIDLIDTGFFRLRAGDEFPVLAGGAIRSFVTNEAPNDFDIFIIGSESKNSPFRNQIIDFFLQIGQKVFECPEHSLFTFKCPFGKVQVITPMVYPNVRSLLDSFDLTPTRGAYDGQFVWCDKSFIRDSKKKILNIHRITYPLATMNRIYKYRSYGFNTFQATEQFIRSLITEEFPESDLYRRYID